MAELSDTKNEAVTLDMISNGKNARGIPTAKFIEDVNEFLAGRTCEIMLGGFNELYSKYKVMEGNLEKLKVVFKSKIPEIQQTLELIRLMIKKREDDEDMIVNYSLSDTIYAKAKVDTASDKLCLWMGANTMVEYSYDEALTLLGEQLEQAQLKIKELDEDLYHLRGNSITVEVNMARLFNHSVKLKKQAESAAVVKS